MQLLLFKKIICLRMKHKSKVWKAVSSFTTFQIVLAKNSENKLIRKSSYGSHCVSNWEAGIKRAQNAFLKHSNDHYCDSNWKCGCLRGNDVICTQNNSVNKHFFNSWIRPTVAETEKKQTYAKNGKLKICRYSFLKILVGFGESLFVWPKTP